MVYSSQPQACCKCPKQETTQSSIWLRSRGQKGGRGGWTGENPFSSGVKGAEKGQGHGSSHKEVVTATTIALPHQGSVPGRKVGLLFVGLGLGSGQLTLTLTLSCQQIKWSYWASYSSGPNLYTETKWSGGLVPHEQPHPEPERKVIIDLELAKPSVTWHPHYSAPGSF